MRAGNFRRSEVENPSITLYSGVLCPGSHRVRLVLALKEIRYKLVNLENPKKFPREVQILSGHPAPVLIDRGLELYCPKVITEYLDERFPYPPLMPIDPISKAKLRLALYHLETEWDPLLKKATSSRQNVAKIARKQLKEQVMTTVALLQKTKFLMQNDPSLADCALGPILLRLQNVGVILSRRTAKVVLDYQKRFFNLPAFRKSLSEEEAELFYQ